MKFKRIFYLIIINLIFFSTVCSATEIELNDKFSKEYKKWLSIPDDKKDDYIIPSTYGIDIELPNNLSAYEISASSNVNSIPESYNSLEKLNITIRDQGITNSCWAISSAEMFEIANAKINNLNETVSYSSRHIEYATSKYFSNDVLNPIGFNRRVGSGGNYEVSMAYFSSGKGPILEKDMMFENNMDLINISEIQNKKVMAQLNDFTKYPNIYKSYDENNNIKYSNGDSLIYTEQQVYEVRNILKQQIMEYGSIGSYIYAPANAKDYNYFSNENNLFYGKSYFCNNTELNINHAICIVGWDDTYSKKNFKDGCQPVNDGAYIALNSWGTECHDNGYFYISYDDYFIEIFTYGIQDVSEKKYDNIYQYDILGNNFSINSKSDVSRIYGANFFEKSTDNVEKLQSVGVYINNNNTNVKIYLSENQTKIDSILQLNCIASDNNLSIGYHVIDINDEILINKNFGIIVEFTNEDLAQLPVEANYVSLGYKDTKTIYNTAFSNSGESYVSTDGIHWKDITEQFPDANICIKAFTGNELYYDEDYILNKNLKILDKNNIKILYGVEEKTLITNFLSKENFLSDYTIKIYKNNNEITTGYITTGTVIKVFKNDILIEELYVVIYGDTTGDGIIQAADALAIIKNNLNTATFFNEVYLEAGRVTKFKRASSTIPNAVDALACVKYKLGTGTISQL